MKNFVSLSKLGRYVFEYSGFEIRLVTLVKILWMILCNLNRIFSRLFSAAVLNVFRKNASVNQDISEKVLTQTPHVFPLTNVSVAVLSMPGLTLKPPIA